MKPFIVIPDGLDKVLFEKLVQNKDLDVHPKTPITQEELKTLLPKVNGLIIRSATTVNKDLLDQAVNLKLVIRAGEGTDNIDKVECTNRSIVVENTPGANSNAVAELVIAFALAILRKTSLADASMRQGKWEKSKLAGNEITGKKVGFVGFGKIAQLTRKRLSGFDIEPFYYDIVEHKNTDAKKLSLEDLFKTCDIISLHLPKTEQTINLVNKNLLSLMKKDAILINTSRGIVVNEDDLHEALANNQIRGAGLDVYCKEPVDSSNPLLKLPNIVLTCHLGASSAEAQFRVGEMCVDQLEKFFKDGTILNQVKK